jgi:hypothetical protein
MVREFDPVDAGGCAPPILAANKTNETNAVRTVAVACHRVVDARGYGGGHVWRDGDIPADELTYWNGLNDGYIVERAHPASAITALEGEVERLKFLVGLNQIAVHERDMKIEMLASKADTAERRLAEVEKELQDAESDIDTLAQHNIQLQSAVRFAERHCPCGARPESPDTHPHIPGCLIAEALTQPEPAK